MHGFEKVVLSRYAYDNENFALVLDADIFAFAENLVIG